MSEPFTERCIYCGSPDVMDDAWWCWEPACWDAYERDERARRVYNKRTALTRENADSDLWNTCATIWGPAYRQIESAAEEIAKLARLPVRLARSA